MLNIPTNNPKITKTTRFALYIVLNKERDTLVESVNQEIQNESKYTL